MLVKCMIFFFKIDKSILAASHVLTKTALTWGGNLRYSPKFTVDSRRIPVSFPLPSSPYRFFSLSTYPALPTRRLYSRDHILRFNLSIVPGITEFRRKNNAYCGGTHKAVAHKTPMSSRMNSGAQARTTCIFMSATGSAHRFFSQIDKEREREPAASNRQYRKSSNHPEIVPAFEIPCANRESVSLYKFADICLWTPQRCWFIRTTTCRDRIAPSYGDDKCSTAFGEQILQTDNVSIDKRAVEKATKTY